MRKSAMVAVFLAVAATLFAADWPTFGWNVGRSSAPTTWMGITAANIGSLRLLRVALDGTVDSSPIYLSGVMVNGRRHDVFFVTTTYGKTIAIDATNGFILWEYTPPDYNGLAGSYRITNATPVAGPDGRFIYAAAPDGRIRKLSVADGSVMWSRAITLLPQREKIAAPLGYFHGHIIAATDGYIGDEPPYQGHVAIINAGSGTLLSVWNSLCSDRPGLIAPSSCPESDSGIWGRAGVVVDAETGNLYLATGNGRWDGSTYWGDSVIELNPEATRILANYTPTITEQLNLRDADLGSTSPVLLGAGLIAQGGKDSLIRLLDWTKMRGTSPHRGGASAQVSTPAGARLFTAPAVWHSGGAIWLLAADNGGTTAWTVDAGGFHLRWHNGYAGTSPVIADGLAFVYDPNGGLRIYKAETGRRVAVLHCGTGHWNSPVVVDGRIAVATGNANHRRTSGELYIWQLD